MPEKALFPMKTLRVTQGYYTNYSHKQSYALDLGGKDGGSDPVYAPFSGTIKRIRSTNGEMWLESDNPVEWADGTIDYMTILFIHANSIPVSVNQHVVQGQHIYNEGNKGNVTGIHVHIECAKGKFQPPYGYYNTGVKWSNGGATYDVWEIYNQVKVNDALFIGDDVSIIEPGNDGNTGEKISWTKASITTSGSPLQENTFFRPIVKNLQFMHTPDVNDVCNDVSPYGYLTEGQVYHALEKTTSSGFTWWKFRYTNGELYWCAMVDGRYETEEAKFDSSKNLTLTSKDLQLEVYNSIDLFDKNDEKLSPNTSVSVISVTEKEWFGSIWYKYANGSKILYIPHSDNITIIEGVSVWENLPPDWAIQPLVGNVEYFNSPNIYDIAPDQYLKKGVQYTAIQRSTEIINNFYWIKIIYTDDKEYYVTNESSKITIGPKTSSPSGDYTANENGIDVSKYQGNINWSNVKNDSKKYTFAFIKCVSTSSSLYVDPYFVQNVQNAQAQGIATGAYIYTYATNTDYIDREVDLCIQQLRSYKWGYPIAWDCEDNSLPQNLTKTQLTDLILYALRRIQSYGYYPILYSYTNFANSYIEMNRIHDSGFDFWCADYRGYCGYKGEYKIWQYSSTAAVNGVSGNCDVNISYWDYPSYIKDLGLNGYEGGGSGTIYPSEPLVGYHIEIYKGNVQYFSYPSIYDENCEYFPTDIMVPITSKLLNEYDGFVFYTCTYNEKTVYVAYVDDGRMAIVKDEPSEYDIPYAHTIYTKKNYILEDRNGHTQTFGTPDVNDKDYAYLGQYKTCRLYARLNEKYGEFYFYAAVIDNKIRYIAIEDNPTKYVTYYGIPYERTVVTDGSMFHIISSGAYAVKYPWYESEHTDLQIGNSYNISNKLNYQYSDMEWYVIDVDGVEMYAPNINEIVLIGPSIDYTEIQVDKHIRILVSTDQGYVYTIANTGSKSKKIEQGTLLSPEAVLEDTYQNMTWYVILVDTEKWYLPLNQNFQLHYEYDFVICDPKFTASITGTIKSFEYASLSAPNKDLSGSIILRSKIKDQIDGKIWYSFQEKDGATRYVYEDKNNVSYTYQYNTVSIPENSYMLAIDDKYKIYDHIPGNLETSTAVSINIPINSKIQLLSKVQEDIVSGIWYVCLFQEKTYYCQDLENSNIVYIYDELPVDEHLYISAKIDGIKAYLYADKACPGFSILPIGIEFKTESRIENISSLNWFKITYNDTIMYVCDDIREIQKTMKYNSKKAIDGSFIIAKQGAIAYRYPGATLEDDQYLLDPNKKYKAIETITEKIDEYPWYKIIYTDTFSITNIDFDRDSGELVDNIPDYPDVELQDIENENIPSYVYSPIDSLHELVYLYPGTSCDPDTYIEILVDSFYFYITPLSNEGMKIIPKGKYKAIKKLNESYQEKIWILAEYNQNRVYVPLIDGQSRIITDGDQEKIIKKIEEIMNELSDIRKDIDEAFPNIDSISTRIEKSRARLRTLELRLYTLRITYWYFFSENEEKPKPMEYRDI